MLRRTDTDVRAGNNGVVSLSEGKDSGEKFFIAQNRVIPFVKKWPKLET